VGVEQFKVDDGTIDLCIFRWDSEIELQCLGVECKPTISAANVYGILDQLLRYRNSFPSLYLLAGSVRNEGSAKEVCVAKGIGLFEATPGKEVKSLVEAGVRDFDEAKFAAIRSIGASLFCFKEKFPDASLESWGARIPHSPGKIQFNVFPNAPTNECRFGVNAENLHAAGVLAHWEELTNTIGKLPEGGLVRVWKNFQQGLLHRVIPVSSVSSQDFEGVKTREGLRKEKNVTWHINVSIPLWSFDEFLMKTQHAARFRKAVGILTPTFEALEGSVGG